MTYLEAVNNVLRGAGMPPVSSLEASPLPPEALRVKAFLDEHLEETLTNDWTFNTQFDVTISPDSNGHITLEDNTVYAEFAEKDIAKDQLVLRGDRLFSRVRGSYQWDHDITLRKIVVSLGWDEIPRQVQQFIVKLAENDFVATVMGEPDKQRHTEGSLVRAWQSLQRYRVKISPKPLMRVPEVLNRRPSYRPYDASRMI
jgi:hypothetical protein